MGLADFTQSSGWRRQAMLRKKDDEWVRLIGLFKLGKGILFLLIGVGFAAFLQKDTAEQVMGWMRLLSLRQENHYIDLLLSWAMGFNRRDIGDLAIGIFVYAVLLLSESAGLLMLKRWAEYLTVLSTATFIPLEIWSDIRRFGLTKSLLLVLNVLAVWYLAVRLWTNRRPLRVEVA